MSSALDVARQTIEAHVRDSLPTLKLEFDGVTHEPIDDAGALRDVWARLTLVWGDAFESTMGEEGVGENVVVGVAVLDLFGDPGKGKGALIRRADECRDLLSRKELAGPIYFRPTSGPTPAVRDREGWLQTTLSTPFEVDEVS